MSYKKITGIYMIKNIVNNKIYIGSSMDIKNRWKGHKHGLRNNISNNKLLQSDWNKFGEHNFIFEIVCSCNADELILKEMEYIKKIPIDNRYNIKIGNIHSNKSKIKTSNSMVEYHKSKSIKTLNRVPNILVDKETQLKIINLYNNNYSMTSISKLVSLSTFIVRRELLNNNIPIRSKNSGSFKYGLQMI